MNRYVFLHGVTRRGDSVRPLQAALAPFFEITAPDFPGHGDAPRNPGRYRVLHHAASVTPEPEAILHGHSMGAMVALALAAQYPDRVSAVILEDPPFHTMGNRIGESPLESYFTALRGFAAECKALTLADAARQLAEIRFGNGIRYGDTRDSAAVRFAAWCLQALDPEVLDPVVERTWMEGYDMLAFAAGVRCPVLILQADGACGGMLTDADASALSHALTDATLLRFAGVGHLIHGTQPALAAQAILNWTATLRGKPC